MRGWCMQDGPLGIRLSDYTSAYPAGITAGSTWSRKLWKARGVNMGVEFKEKGADVLLGPVAGPIGRQPEGGRNWEGFTSDPYMSGIAMAESITGMQSSGVVACAKHFVGNEQEHFRQAPEAVGYGYNITDSSSSNIDDKTLHELYAWPFADAIKAGVGSIMCSYQMLNNSYPCQNSKLINGILKGEMGFPGFVMSDWQAQHSGASSAAAGLDMTMPGDTLFNTGRSYWGTNLTLAVVNGTVAEWRIDDMAVRLMAAWFKVGREVGKEPDINFSAWTRNTIGPVQVAANENFQQVNFQVDVRHNHAKHIRESAAKGAVVLKNNGVLPLHKPKFLGIIGEDAGGNPAGPNGCGDRGCDNGTLAMGWGSGTSQFPYLITPDAAIQAQSIQDNTRYESVLSNYDFTSIDALITQPNVTAIVFANADSGEGYINIDGNEGDRKNLTLWKGGDNLIKHVAKNCPNTIVVLHTVGAVLVKDWYDNKNISAIVWAGIPGQESGNSLVDLLYGKVSGGRTPFTWGPTADSYGTKVLTKPNNGHGAPQIDFNEGVFTEYRHFDKVAPYTPGSKSSSNYPAPGAPIYEFGFGLSWTTFEYSNIKVTKHNVAPYKPTTGKTTKAPTFGDKPSKDLKDYLYPAKFRKFYEFIYPWLNTTDAKKASGSSDYGQPASKFLPKHALDGSSQAKNPAGGAPGGNPQLWDVLYDVSVTIKNTGSRTSDEIPQVYVSHGGPGEPARVLRGFDRVENIAPGKSVTYTAQLTRRDLSNWNVVTQNWEVTKHAKHVYVGSSSRNLPVGAKLQ